MSKHHNYTAKIEWTGNQGEGTASYKAYSRDHMISGEGKQIQIPGSSDPSFRGDSNRYNPEELFLASLSSCHMLWYLHLCSVHKVIVSSYVDLATGTMEESENGSGRFKEVTLHPKVYVEKGSMIKKALELHHEANEMCFIANSCNFSIKHEAEIVSLD